MKNVNIENPVGQKLASVYLTKALRSKFNLYPTTAARDLLELCKKEGLDPLETMMFLGASLPDMVVEFLAEVQKIVEKNKGQPARA